MQASFLRRFGQVARFRGKFYVSLLGFTLATVACEKHPTRPPSADIAPTTSPAPSQVTWEACGLLKRDEIEAIQGSRITDEKSSEHVAPELRASQCYYTAEQANRSVSLGVTQSSAKASGQQALKDYWNRMFSEQDKEEEGEKRVPPKRIESLGEEAYWLGNRVGGTLYVLKSGAFIRLSLGGSDNEEAKIDKSKRLAEKALARL